MVKRVKIFIVLVSIFSVFFSVSHAEVMDRIVAVVNEDIITLIELDKAISPYLLELEKTGYSHEKKEKIITKLQKDMLTKMIEFKLTEQEAERLNIKVSPEELEASIDQFLDQENITIDVLKKALLKEKITYEEYKSDIKNKILRPKLVNLVIRSKVVITNEEIGKYYEDHTAEYSGEKKYHLRNILVSLEQEIIKIKTMLDQGESFSKMAKEYSLAPNALSGGDLGAFELDVFADNIREHILLLKEHQYTDAILTDGGYQIFYLEKIDMKDSKSLEQAKDEIVRKLFSVKAEKKYEEWFKGLKERSHIQITL